MARRDASAGLASIVAAQAADPRPTDLFRKIGVVYEYVYDYDTGAVKIGDVAGDGSITML